MGYSRSCYVRVDTTNENLCGCDGHVPFPDPASLVLYSSEDLLCDFSRLKAGFMAMIKDYILK
jgi:hypothetical protein